MSGIGVKEEPAPHGQKPIDWLLLTTVTAHNFAQAGERIEWYRSRWMIEIYHQVLTSGCRIESRQLETANRLERYLAIDSVVAWRILGLTFKAEKRLTSVVKFVGNRLNGKPGFVTSTAPRNRLKNHRHSKKRLGG